LSGSGLVVYRVNYSQHTNFYFPYELYAYHHPKRGNGIFDAFFSSEVSRTIINDYTNPAILLSDSTRGGVNITNIGYAGETIQFDVHFPSSTIDFIDIEQYDEGLLELKWNLVFEDWVKQYNIYRSIGNTNIFEKIDVVEHPYTIFEDTSLINHSNYHYKIVAEDTLGMEREYSEIVNTTVELPDAIPQNLIAEPLSEKRVKIKWNVGVGSWVYSYDIFRKQESDNTFKLITNIPKNVTEFIDKNLISGKIYNYEVISIDKYGNERGASETNVKIFSPPTSSNATISINEDEMYDFNINDFEFNDLDKHTFGGIKIIKTPNSNKGNLIFNQSTVKEEQIINNIDQLIFKPAVNQFGSPLTNFEFKVIDESGDISNGTYTFTFNVLPINDSPSDFYLKTPIHNDTLKISKINL